MNVRNLDLNLLVLFDALIEEGNLTRAAARVGLSQPAMSNALARLRSQLDDPLFVRAASGLEPTRRARRMAGPIRAALHDIESALASEVFDPKTSTQTFTVMMNDIHELVLGPRLSARVAARAPNAQLRFLQGPSTGPDEALSSGVDIVISPMEAGSPSARRSPLYQLDFAVLVRRRHPRVGRRLTTKQYLELEHVLVAPRGRPGGVVDDVLAQRGLHRRVARIVGHFMSAVFLVCRSEYAATLPSILAESMAAALPVRLLELPLQVPSVSIGQFWARKNDADPAHRWLRQLLEETAQETV